MKKLVLRLFCALVALILSSGALSVFGASSASAGTTYTYSNSCTSTTDSTGVTVNNCAVEGTVQFNVNESFNNAGALQLVTKGHAYLTFQTHPMTKSQITGKCVTLPLGTPFWNGFVDTKTGKVKYKKWHVTSGPGENKFCPGKNHKMHKLNCNNPVKGVPFGTSAPPKKKRIKAHAFTGDYLQWVANLTLVASKHVGGSIEVHNADNTCKITALLDNQVQASDVMWVSVRARSVAQARSAAVSSVKAKANSDQKVKSDLEQYISLYIHSEISGKCTTTSTPTPPSTPAPTLVEITTVNDVLVGNSRTLNVSGTVASGHTAVLFCAAKNGGTITYGKQQTVAGSFTATIGYTAPSEVPTANGDIAAGHDRVDCALTQDDDQSASISSNQFEIRQLPSDPA